MSFARKDGAKAVNNILIRNLSQDATEQDIRSLFAGYGTIGRFKILTDSKTGQPKAFVELTEDEEVETAIHATIGTDLRGTTVIVNSARPQLHRGSRSKRSGRCVSIALHRDLVARSIYVKGRI
jgi:RNA recognition motif-containing protein